MGIKRAIQENRTCSKQRERERESLEGGEKILKKNKSFLCGIDFVLSLVIKKATSFFNFVDKLEDGEDGVASTRRKPGSINYMLWRLTAPMSRIREDEEDEEEKVRGTRCGVLVGNEAFEEVIGVERRKMEMMREIDRCWLEMENRHYFELKYKDGVGYC